MANDSNVQRKTNAKDNTLPEVTVTATPDTSNIPKALYDPNDRNVLHSFRSFNYLFTLAAVGDSELKDPNILRSNQDYFVVARSSGKTGKDIKVDKVKDQETKTLIDGFNEFSSGRFDLFLNNVEIETLMAFSKTTNLTLATKLSFEVFEPYGISGFIEALQVGAIAAGNKSYMSAPFLLKMEFIGYKDTDDQNPQLVGDQATRYFIIVITKVEVEMNETGTRYRCQAVVHNELGYGTVNKTKSAIHLEGNTVGKVLNYLMDVLNKSSEYAAKKDFKEDGKSVLTYDKYKIIFPTKTDNGFNYEQTNKDIAEALIVEDFSSPNNFAMDQPSEVAAKNDQAAQKGLPKIVQDCLNDGANKKTTTSARQLPVKTQNSSFSFPAGSNPADIIASVIRDSSYGKKIVKEKPDQDGMVMYVNVAIEAHPTGQWNSMTRRPTYEYVYVVLPYKMHASRVPHFQKQLSDDEVNKLKKLYVKRRYQYIYTGQNVDIRRFNLRFNTLFYQAYPEGMGNIFADPRANVKTDPAKVQIIPSDEKYNKQSIIPPAPRISDPKLLEIQKHGGTANRRDYRIYDILVENMHSAVLNNLDMISCELEILGDPYFLCTGGIGNYRPKLKDGGITTDGEAPFQSGDVIIVVDFKSPVDAGVDFDKMKFYNTAFSGCFRVTKVRSKFSDGLFTQVLSLIRIPGQPEEVNPGTKVVSADTPDKYYEEG